MGSAFVAAPLPFAFARGLGAAPVSLQRYFFAAAHALIAAAKGKVWMVKRWMEKACYVAGLLRDLAASCRIGGGYHCCTEGAEGAGCA